MINSVVLRHAKPNYGAYKMAKHALLGMARNLACEVGPQGIRVNSVAPGYVGDATVDLVARLQGMAEKRPEPEVKRELLDTLMLRRAAEPEEIADAVVFFASDMSRSITGQCLDVNGGEYAH
jgi:NAD(P)-dependent dehydrogenase (short-subunit alcohol dehydrogenase family)